MPIVRYAGREVFCPEGANLKDVLVRAELPPHNGPTKYVNCHGLGTCGTCAVDIEGPVSSPGLLERIRLALPPHRRDSGLRLACKVRVLGDLEVTKHPGLWGQKTPDQKTPDQKTPDQRTPDQRTPDQKTRGKKTP